MASPPDYGASRKAEPAADSQLPPSRSLGKVTCKGLIMEQLEIIDLGDAITETRCSNAIASTFDAVYGLGHRTC